MQLYPHSDKGPHGVYRDSVTNVYSVRWSVAIFGTNRHVPVMIPVSDKEMHY
jgi:hypothetical protein